MTLGNLTLSELTGSQNQKHITANSQVDEIDDAMTEFTTVSLAAGNVTLDDGGAGLLSYKRNQVFVLSGHTVARDFTLPAVKRLVVIKNDGTASGAASIKRGSTTHVLPISETRLYYTDGTANGLYLVTSGTLPIYDLGINRMAGAPTASEVLLDFVFTRSVNYLALFAGSVGVSGVAADAQTDFDIKKNGSSIGTMRFAAAATSATFLGSAVSFAANDRIQVVAPGSPDADLAEVSFTLAGYRTL